MHEVKEYEYIGPEGDIGGDVDEMYRVWFYDGTVSKKTESWMRKFVFGGEGEGMWCDHEECEYTLEQLGDDQWLTGCPMCGLTNCGRDE